MGGHWGAELRFAGFDGLIITGRAPEPVYLWLHDGLLEIRPAAHLWGLDHFEVFAQLRAETDPKAQIAAIGLAGENQVRLAVIMQGGQEHARTSGRGGMGALMGSKDLKAIVVRGSAKPTYPDLKAFRAFVQGAARVSGQRIAETIFEKHTHCFACPIGCGKTVRITEGPYAGVYGHGPEYETLAGFGGNCQCDDLEAVSEMNDLCNRYGLDTISTSSVIAFAMEAYEKGLLSAAQTGGLELTCGNAEAIIDAIHAIARSQGIGELLGQGVRAAAQRLGPAADAFAIHVKGMEIPYHDPRAFLSMAANYATATRGACHLESLSYWLGYGVRFEGWVDPEQYDRLDSKGKGEIAADFQNYMAVFNPLGLCKFIAKSQVGPQHIADLVNVALGWDWTADDVLTTGERLFDLKRLINHRFGITAADDTLPPRLLSEPRPTGSAAGVLPDLKLMLEEYYRRRDWTADGLRVQKPAARSCPSSIPKWCPISWSTVSRTCRRTCAGVRQTRSMGCRKMTILSGTVSP